MRFFRCLTCFKREILRLSDGTDFFSVCGESYGFAVAFHAQHSFFALSFKNQIVLVKDEVRVALKQSCIIFAQCAEFFIMFHNLVVFPAPRISGAVERIFKALHTALVAVKHARHPGKRVLQSACKQKPAFCKSVLLVRKSEIRSLLL